MKKLIAISAILFAFISVTKAQTAQKQMVFYANMEKDGEYKTDGQVVWEQTVIMRTCINITSERVLIDNATHRAFSIAPNDPTVTIENKDGSTSFMIPASDKNGEPCQLILLVQKDGTTTFSVYCKRSALQFPVPTRG
jgi:hypothetical protein